VFSDFHLFGELAPESVSGHGLSTWIHRFGLSNVVQVAGDRISTTSLSQGQRERLAFAFACSYPSEIVVLDEVSSNQDARFRNTIYHEILPELKSAGKTVIVITHDERYFDVADVLLTFEHGKLANPT
jgi:putative ATP-binding cassette transporter